MSINYRRYPSKPGREQMQPAQPHPLRQGIGCGFCKRNKEPEAVYKSHQLRTPEGQVSCPQLSKYRCELCGATGAEAHTRSYCPQASHLRQLTSSLEGRSNQPQQERFRQRRHHQQYYHQQQRVLTNDNNFNADHQERSAYARSSDTLQMNNARLFANMGLVTSSRYNSAGVRRERFANDHKHNHND